MTNLTKNTLGWRLIRWSMLFDESFNHDLQVSPARYKLMLFISMCYLLFVMAAGSLVLFCLGMFIYSVITAGLVVPVSMAAAMGGVFFFTGSLVALTGWTITKFNPDYQ